MCLTSALPKILTEVETFGERCRLIRKTKLKLFILLAMHKVEMQKEVKPVDCWLRSDPENLGLPSTASQ